MQLTKILPSKKRKNAVHIIVAKLKHVLHLDKFGFLTMRCLYYQAKWETHKVVMPFTSLLGKNYISHTWNRDAQENAIFVNPASHRAGYCKVNNYLPFQVLLGISK